MEYRGYLLKPLGTFPMLAVHSKGSGSIPNDLKGTFTTHKDAEIAVDRYLNSLKKGSRNGKAKGSGTG